MKKIIICIIVLIAFISISIFVESKLQESANEILKDIDLLYNQISDENWDKVDKDLKKLEFIETSLEIFDISNSVLDNNNTLIMEVVELYIDNVKKLDRNLFIISAERFIVI